MPAGAPTPITVSMRLALSGYQFTLHGPASIARGKELAHLAGIPNATELDSLAGEPVSVDLIAEGPWSSIQSPDQLLSATAIPPAASPDSLTGTVTLRNANWKAGYLANHIEISQATLHIASGQLRFDPVLFSYGPVKGTATLTLPACAAPQTCTPVFQLEFAALDAAVLQAAFLGAREKGTMISTLLDRLRSTAAPAWPHLEGTVKADSLVLGPVTLHNPTATVSTLPDGASISAFDAALLGGRVHGTGTYHAALAAKDKPSYELEGQLEKLSPQLLGQLLGLRASGSAFNGNGKIALSGFIADDLAASAKGTLHFEWERGTITGNAPPALARFERWVADAEIANGSLTLKENQLKRGAGTVPIQAAIPLAIPPKVAFTLPKTPPR
jgi:hypothetical protein